MPVTPKHSSITANLPFITQDDNDQSISTVISTTKADRLPPQPWCNLQQCQPTIIDSLTTTPPSLPITPLASSIIHSDTGIVYEYHDLIKQPKCMVVWMQSFSNKPGCLTQGNAMTTGTDTIFFIQKSCIPQGCTVTYGRIVVAYHPQKANPYQTWLTIGRDCIHYPHDASTSTAYITTVKLLVNSIISTPNARFLTLDIKNYYLGTPLDNMNTFSLTISIFWMTLPWNTTSMTWQTRLDGYTWKKGKACMAWNKPESLHINYSSNASIHMDTTPSNSLMTSGDTNGDQ